MKWNVKKPKMERRKAEVHSKLKRTELLLQFQTDVRKIEADLIKKKNVDSIISF